MTAARATVGLAIILPLILDVAGGRQAVASPAAAELHVPGAYPTIQAAVDAAANGDTIVVADGVYTGTGNCGVDFSGKDVVLRSAGGRDACTIHCDEGGTATLRLVNGESPRARIEGFTISGSMRAIRCEGSSPTIIGCRIAGSYFGGAGGGLYSDGGSPTIVDCTFEDNIILANEAYGAGAFFMNGSPMLIGCSFIENQAWGIAAGAGGGLATEDTVAMRVVACTFYRNWSVGLDGQQGMQGYAGGAALRLLGSGTEVINCLVAENFTSASLPGGLDSTIENHGTNTVLINCTVAENNSGFGPQVLNEGTLHLVNCIVWSSFRPSVAGSEATTSAAYSIVRNGWPGPGVLEFAPQLDADYLVTVGSPAIDAGDNTAVPLDITTDLEGNPRFDDHLSTPNVGVPDGTNPPVDMGAFELPWCDGDANQDGAVDVVDLVAVIVQFGNTGGGWSGDVDADGTVDVADLVLVILHFGLCPFV